MLRRFQHFFVLAQLVGLTCLLVACDPCSTLAELKCECETTLAAKQACQKKVSAAGAISRVSKDMATKVCSRALETCTCEALERNELEKCGVTREPPEGQQ